MDSIQGPDIALLKASLFTMIRGFMLTRLVILFMFCVLNSLHANEPNNLQQALRNCTPPFNYPINITLLPLNAQNARTMVCFHGAGSDCQIAHALRTNPVIKAHLVGFNFPDYGDGFYGQQTTFGTIQELLPALFVINRCVIQGKLDAIDLYGFSAGGAALVNMIAVLNSDQYERELSWVGITQQNKKKILEAIQNGHVILECPLKSMEEVIWYRGNSHQTSQIAKQYRENNLRPIDSLKSWEGLELSVILYFQTPDEILSNRDDALFLQTLQSANRLGKTRYVTSNEGGHSGYHASLWAAYQEE